MRWNIASKTIPKNSDELVRILLDNREITDRQEFLDPTPPSKIHLEDVGIDTASTKRAVDRLLVAKEKKEKVIIYGDYDCDGVCATTVLWETLHACGIDCFPFLPDREKHGYGLSQKGVDEILANGQPAILISVDNGIVAHTQWKRLRELGIYTILTDHHEPDGEALTADCVIHTTKLCGTTVAWMFAREVANRILPTENSDIEEMLDLCAIATIADQVPLIGANRSFATDGLQQLNKTKRLGLQLLIEASGLEKGKIDTYGVNFGIAPRINAMGRISSAMDALRALCTTNRERAERLISVLSETNTTRQDLTQEMLEIAMSEQESWKDDRIIVVASDQFHEGVIGLTAGKLTETFHKPAVAFALGDTTAKGSARSVAGVHITNILRRLGDDVLEVGGHPLAAGLKIETTKLVIVKERLQELAIEMIDIRLLSPAIDVDCEIPVSLVTLDTTTEIASLAPFGSGNPPPLFLCKDWEILDVKQIGKEGKHLKFSLFNSQFSMKMDGLFWGAGKRVSEFEAGQHADTIGQLQVNEWRDKKSLQLVIKDIK